MSKFNLIASAGIVLLIWGARQVQADGTQLSRKVVYTVPTASEAERSNVNLLFLASAKTGPEVSSSQSDVRSAGQEPKVEVVSPQYDFGTVREGTLVKHVFTLRNAGNAELVIKGVHASCGCTAAKPTRERLKPGESADLEVTFDTRFEKGYRSRTVVVSTNDPRTPEVELVLKGQIQVTLEAKPSEVNFGTVHHGEQVIREVEIVSYDGKPLGFSKISNSNPNLKVDALAPKSSDSSRRLQITLSKTMPPGTFYDNIQIATKDKSLVIPVFGRVVGDLVAEPPQVSFGVVGVGRGAVRILRLANLGQRPIKLLNVSSSDPNVTVNAEETKPGKEFKLIVGLARTAPQGHLHGTLKVLTDNPQESSLTIPFYAIIGDLRS